VKVKNINWRIMSQVWQWLHWYFRWGGR